MGKGAQRLPAVEKPKVISWQEVAKHRTPQDCWMVHNNKVYDVSNWHEHPGGDVIFTHAGDDCTDIFAAFHAQGSMKALRQFEIGELEVKDISFAAKGVKSAEQLAFEKGYRELRANLRKDGLFEASVFCYIRYQLTNFAIVAGGAACAAYGPTSAVRLFGAVLCGLFFQQCGWLCHDFLHHQVFKNREMNHLIGLFWGNVAQGFSAAWWANKHNSHHAVPNLHESTGDSADGDPDIDTMPYLAWTSKMAAHASEWKYGRFCVENQKYIYFPLLGLARVSWLMQSWSFVLGQDNEVSRVGRLIKGSKTGELKPVKNHTLEAGALALHYVWFFAIVATLPAIWEMVAFVLLANVSTGLFLALVFGLGHNGMAVYDGDTRPDFWRLQVTTTRNITGGPFVHWFCGGLHYQVEHHLFPQLPRHSLAAAHERVVDFCKKFGVTYHETSLLQGTKEVLSHLGSVTEEFVKEFPAM